MGGGACCFSISGTVSIEETEREREYLLHLRNLVGFSSFFLSFGLSGLHKLNG